MCTSVIILWVLLHLYIFYSPCLPFLASFDNFDLLHILGKEVDPDT